MKPVKSIPGVSYYGEVGTKRFQEIQKFIAAKCKYAEVEIFSVSLAKDATKRSYIEKTGYDGVLNSYDFEANVRCLARNGKVYLENLDIEEEE